MDLGNHKYKEFVHRFWHSPWSFFMLFSLLILLVYSLLMFLQLANQTSSNKIKVYFPQNFCNSLVPQHTQKTGNQTSWTVQTTKKKFNYFKTCNSWLWKRWKLSNYDISGSMRQLTFRGSRLKTVQKCPPFSTLSNYLRVFTCV